MFAVIQTGGKQYVVKEGDMLRVEKLGADAGQNVLFDQVLLIEQGEETLIGTPRLETAVVKAEVVANIKDDKVLVFKKKRRKQFRRTRGHRQSLTEVRIVAIYPDRNAVGPDELAAKAVAVAEKAPEEKPAKTAPKPKPAKKAVEAPSAAPKKPAAKEKPKKAAAPKPKDKGKTAKPAPKSKGGAKKAAK